MEAIVEEVVAPEDLQKFKQKYMKEQESLGKVSAETQFSYAWCLVRSANKQDVHLGIQLLKDLFQKTKDETAKRDYLYYLAIGHTRLKEYNEALKFSNAILQVEQGNHQAVMLSEYIEKKMKKEGLIGMAIVGGAAAIAIGGLVGLGVALSKK